MPINRPSSQFTHDSLGNEDAIEQLGEEMEATDLVQILDWRSIADRLTRC